MWLDHYRTITLFQVLHLFSFMCYVIEIVDCVKSTVIVDNNSIVVWLFGTRFVKWFYFHFYPHILHLSVRLTRVYLTGNILNAIHGPYAFVMSEFISFCIKPRAMWLSIFLIFLINIVGKRYCRSCSSHVHRIFTKLAILNCLRSLETQAKSTYIYIYIYYT